MPSVIMKLDFRQINWPHAIRNPGIRIVQISNLFDAFVWNSIAFNVDFVNPVSIFIVDTW